MEIKKEGVVSESLNTTATSPVHRQNNNNYNNNNNTSSKTTAKDCCRRCPQG